MLIILSISIGLNLIGAILLGRFYERLTTITYQYNIEHTKTDYYEARISLLEMKLWNAGLSDDSNEGEKYEE
jgi:hypothetical protein